MKKLCFLSMLLALPFNVYADTLSLNDALRVTYSACVGIDDELHDLKVLAGVNTAVTAVGTGLGAGALGTGIAKAGTDKEAASYEEILKQLREQTKNVKYDDLSEEDVAEIDRDFDASYDAAIKAIEEYEKELAELNKKSKKLGNWRTGLSAGATVTNVAGAIISSQTIKGDLQNQIDACVDATKKLNDAILVAKMNGEDTSEAKQIYEACRDYEFIDISPIKKRGTGAMVASSVGAVTGGVGTITSAVANTDKTRNDNSGAGKKKEKDLNTTANVMAGATTAASAAATVLNGTQIAAIKKVAKQAAQCTEVLK